MSTAPSATSAEAIAQNSTRRRSSSRGEWIFITWYPYCRRSDALGAKLNARSYLIHYFRFKDPRVAPVKYLLQTLKTGQVLLKHRPGGVLVATPPVVAPLIIWLGSILLRYRFVIDAHSGVFQHSRWSWALPLQKFLSKRASLTLVTNEHMAAQVRGWGARAHLVQDLALDLNTRGPAVTRERFHVVYICTYSGDEPIEAVKEAARILPGVDFSFTGDPSYAASGFRRGLPTNVHLKGFMRDEDYLALLRGADAILVLTKENHTMQRGGYEAMALEKPLVTSRWPLLEEVFCKGTEHVDNSPREIVAAIERIRRDPAGYRARMAQLKKERAAVSEKQLSVLRVVTQSTLPEDTGA